MSTRREDIKNTFWEDEDVDELSNSAVLLYLWSFTNPKCGMAGIYRCKRRGLCEGRLTKKQLDKALGELQAADLLHYLDGWLWVTGRVKNLSALNQNIARAIVRDVDALPDLHDYRAAFVARYADYGKLTHALSLAKKPPLAELGLTKPFPQPSDNGSETHSGGDGDGVRDGDSPNALKPETPSLHSPVSANVVATTGGGLS